MIQESKILIKIFKPTICLVIKIDNYEKNNIT